MFNSGTHPRTLFGKIYRTIEGGNVWRGELCNRAKDGSLYWVDTTIVPQLDSDGKPDIYMAIRFDITARKLAEAKISHMAGHDALTGIGNRTLLHQKLGELLARDQQHQETFAVLLLDLDGFKHINDTLGHAAGDKLLKQLVQRLSALLGENDTLTRLGGDEFAIIQGYEDDQHAAAGQLSGKVLDVVSQPFDLDGYNVVVGTSIGIALAPKDGIDTDELLQKADLALYRLKSEGRNNFRFFDDEMASIASERLRLVDDLRAGLSRNEFELYYQPIFDAKTCRPCSAAALVRWNHPTDGIIPPIGSSRSPRRPA